MRTLDEQFVSRDDFNYWLQLCQSIMSEAVKKDEDVRFFVKGDIRDDGWIFVNRFVAKRVNKTRTGKLHSASFSLGPDKRVFVITHPFTPEATYWIDVPKIRRFIYSDRFA